MKRFISTKLFLALQEASQKNIEIDVQVLENSYDEFVNRLFKDCTAENRSAYRNSLVYTHAELASLTGVSEKKCPNLSWQSQTTY
ncbi:MAG: hypothetical protein LBG28_07685 [Tannerella sp.]|jgi:hypothetical protein|nr:hypothetical protein [Tannerella sp.]